jgi:hypothetical protein
MPVSLLPASNHRTDSHSTQDASKPQPSMSPTVKSLVAITLVGFGLLHLIAGAIVQRASVTPPIETMMIARNGD